MHYERYRIFNTVVVILLLQYLFTVHSTVLQILNTNDRHVISETSKSCS